VTCSITAAASPAVRVVAMRSWMLFLLSLLAFSCFGAKAKAEDITLKQLSGARIDSNWFRYFNSRFGLAIDIPTKGYRYAIPVNGSGLGLTSLDGEVDISISAHFVVNLLETANNDVRTSISELFDKSVRDTLKKKGTVEYSVRRDSFYVISGKLGNGTYYERLTISDKCPAIFNSVRIFHPSRLEGRLHQLTTRLSNSLTATCMGEEGAARIE
jgi:hypothetical protein